MHESCVYLGVLFVNAMRTCVLGGFICVLRWTTYQNVQYVQNGDFF